MHEDRDLHRRLAALGLPDDLVENVLDAEPQPSNDAIDRIRQITLRRALAGAPVPGAAAPRPTPRPAPRPAPRRIWWSVAAAAAVLAMVITLAVGPARVMAELRHALSFVPGFGLRPAGSVELSLARTVRVQRGDALLEVRGLVADAGGITLYLYAEQFALTPAHIVDERGVRFVPHAHSMMNARGTIPVSHGWFALDGKLDPATRQVTVVVPGEPEWRVKVALMPGAALLPADEFGPAATVNGYTIAAQVAAGADRTRVDLLIQGGPPGVQVREVGQHFGAAPATRLPTLTPTGGAPVPVEPADGTGNAELRHMRSAPLPAGAATATLTIPLLVVSEPGEAQIKLPVQTGPIDRVLPFGPWALRVVRTEITADDRLRLYVDLGAEGAAYLRGIGDIRSGRQPFAARTAKYQEDTGRLDWVEVEVPSGARSIALTFVHPEVVVQGPWVIEAPVVR